MHHLLIYEMQHRPGMAVAAVYLVVTCGRLLCSSRRPGVILGGLNVVGAAATVAIKASAFKPLWWADAALMSVLIVCARRALRTAEVQSSGVSPARPFFQ
ncbi:MAG TPA: DUF6629 family protein [Acidimicrobiia bacterium]|nr:DUF6629 family protein [Acidimicrobiia bacterium]